MIAGASGARYPRQNFFPASLEEVGFVDGARGDYRLADASRYKKAGLGGADPGIDPAALAAARAAAGRSASRR